MEDEAPHRMSALTEFLFPTPAKRSVGAIFKWWEKRRLAFNAAMVGGGLFTYAYGTLITLMPPNVEGLEYPPWEGPITVLVVANLIYLLGPTAETLLGRALGRDAPSPGPALYRAMLTLGVGAALFPSLMMTFIWIARFLEWIS